MKSIKQISIIIALIAVVVIGIYSYSSYTPDSNVESAQIAEAPSNTETAQNQNSDSLQAVSQGEEQPIKLDFFEFEGYSVGKSHTGTFDSIETAIIVEDNKIVLAEVVIQTDSVNTGIGGLDDHLVKSDMLDATSHPEITFSTTNINYDANQASGVLTFLGVSKEISIPITVQGTTVSTDFLLDISEFGMEYTGVNPEVRIAFSVSP